MALKLYNSLTRKKEIFKPLIDKRVSLYTCGPTVYSRAHLGNWRTFIFEDVLRRVLEFNGYSVKQVMNITDVGHLTSDADSGEDKIELAAARENKTASQIANYYIRLFQRDLKWLNILPAHFLPRATQNIKEQIVLIKKLEQKGYTYRTSDGIYFNTARFQSYGQLANIAVQKLKEGARVAKNPEKRNATDFALWKFSPKGSKRQMEWKSPWGIGFPGWHIECSAMAMKYLGPTIDIHTGGIDHLSIHHNNEIAQSEAATGKKFVNYWLHGEFLNTGTEKMAKSTGNFLTLDSLAEKHITPLTFRYYCLTTHYRKPLTFSWKGLAAAQSALDSLTDAIRNWPAPVDTIKVFDKKFEDAVADDLNTPKALAVVWELIKSNEPLTAKKNTLLNFDQVLGLGLKDVKALNVPSTVQKLVDERETARQNKDFTRADELRKKIESAGFTVDDTLNGPTVK